jgi:MFS family permease
MSKWQRVCDLALSVGESVFRPTVLLIFFTIVNLLNYADRGAVGASVAAIKDQYKVTDFQMSMCASAFMFGYMLTSPIFAQLAYRILPTRLMCFGLLVWCGATFLTASAPTFWVLILARALSGVGEASFCAIAPTTIDNVAPAKSRTTWLSIFFAAIPCGYAVGYVVGGSLAEYATWRLTFVLEALVMLPFAIACLCIPRRCSQKVDSESSGIVVSSGTADEKSPMLASAERSSGTFVSIPPESPHTDGIADADGEHASADMDTKPPFLVAVRLLAKNGVFVYNSLGYTFLTGCLGSYAFWLPYFMHEHYGVNIAEASVALGGLALMTGLGGTGLGGYVLDRLGGSMGMHGASRALRLCFIFTLVGFPLAFTAFLVDNLVAFVVLLLAAEFVLFGTTSPINAAALSCVPEHLRSHAMACQIFMIHAGGDFSVPLLLGLIADSWSMVYGLAMITLLLLLASALFFFSSVLAKRRSEELGERHGQGATELISRKPIGRFQSQVLDNEANDAL